MRKQVRALASGETSRVEAQAFEEEKALVLRRWADGQQALACFNFGENAARVTIDLRERSWRKVLNSRDERWGGPGSSLPECLASSPSQPVPIEPYCFALYSGDERGTK